MKRRAAAGARVVRAVLVGGVLACLLFSVGEGLRLTPLPVSAHAAAGSPAGPAGVTRPPQTRLKKHNPLDVPAQAQKRGKRPVLEFGGPPAARTAVPPARLAEPAFEDGLVNLPKPRRGSPPQGRAPPRAS